ncbi:MAG TPA: ABC transporter permease [Acidobacteriaceae bacterium]|nr:ABC transporter permease [Acidobacteriaceae bacterium]
MRITAWLRSVGSKFFRRDVLAEEVSEELREHIALRADDLERQGLSRPEAERRARIEFGGVEKFREESHEALGGAWLETLLADIRYSLRVLRKSPGFVVAAVVTLAMAIAANAIVFGLMDGLILRPLNVPHGESLIGLPNGSDPGFESYANYKDLRDRNHSFVDLAAFSFAFVALDTGNDPAPANGFSVTGNYFDVLGIKPYLGRVIHASDERGQNSAPYVVLTWAYWHRRFHEDRGVVGRVVQINKRPFTIVGVTPPGFIGTLMFMSPDFFVPIVTPLSASTGDVQDVRTDQHGVFESFGHLKPGITQAQAESDCSNVAAYLAKTYPKEFSQRTPVVLGRVGLTAFAGGVKAFIGGLMLLAVLILLGACANLGSLFAARASDRSREVALRLALGSSRKRILRQLFTEAVLVSLAGGVVGLALSVVLLRRISAWHPIPAVPIQIPVTPDAKIYIVALALALVSGFLFALVPVRQILRSHPYEIVKAGPGLRVSRRVSLRDALLVVQVAICGVLVTASLVAVRGLMRSLHGDFGFEPRDTAMVSVDLAQAGYSGAEIPAMQKRLIHAMEGIPGVQNVGLVNNYPPLVYTGADQQPIFRENAGDLTPLHAAMSPFAYGISPGYLEAARTSLLAGRDFTWQDGKDAPAVAIANVSFAEKMFGSVNGALGRYFKLKDGTRVQVTGVMEDGKYLTLTEEHEPAIFVPFAQSPMAAAWLVLRSQRDPVWLAAAIRAEIRKVDLGLPSEVRSWNELLQPILFPARMATLALGVMGLMGAMLSITGIFGMAAYSVSRRLRELGIRMALGAQRREVLRAALGRAVRLLAIGSAAGLALGVLASHVLASIVYQATPRDPLVLTGVVLTMGLLGLVATWIPAQRALSIDPLILLHEE